MLFILATRDNSSVFWAVMPLYLVLMLLNLPGWFLARGLGLLARDVFNPPPDPDPIAGGIVMFGGSTLFWVLVVGGFYGPEGGRTLGSSKVP